MIDDIIATMLHKH